MTSPDQVSPNPRFGVYEFLACTLLILATGINYAFVLEQRLYIRDVPVSFLDMCLLALGVAAIFRLLVRRTARSRKPISVVLAYFALATSALIGVHHGLLMGYSTYEIARDFRVLLYLLTVFLLFTWFLSPAAQRRFIIPTIILCGIAVALQQLVTFTFKFLQTGNFELSRDVYIPAQVLPIAMVYLLGEQQSFKTRFQKLFFTVCLALFSLAAVVSLTRVVWLQFVLTFCFVGILLNIRWRLLRTAAVICIVIVVMVQIVEVSGYVPGITADMYRRARELGDFLRGVEHGSVLSRFDEIRAGMEMFMDRPGLGWGFGTSVTHFEAADRQMLSSVYLHNSVVYYAVKLGIVGLTAFALLCVVCLLQAWRVPRSSEYSIRALLLLAGICGFAVAGNFSGNLSFPPFMILLAALLCQCLALGSLAQEEAITKQQSSNRNASRGAARDTSFDKSTLPSRSAVRY